MRTKLKTEIKKEMPNDKALGALNAVISYMSGGDYPKGIGKITQQSANFAEGLAKRIGVDKASEFYNLKSTSEFKEFVKTKRQVYSNK